MDAFSLDQFRVFVAVADEGGFAPAARRLNRAQSAITYAIQNLEEASGVALFDRSGYRARLTEAGEALMPRARRLLADVADFALLAKGVGQGLEAELSLVIDAFAPLAPVVTALADFQAKFPSVRLRLATESLSAVLELLSQGECDLALAPNLMPAMSGFERRACGRIDLIPVAAPGHPLALADEPLTPERLSDHTQIVLSARPPSGMRREFGVHAVNRWRVADLEVKLAMLLAGIGWGTMPSHRIADELAAGRLVELKPTTWEGSNELPNFRLVVAHRRDRALGPAGRWLFERLAVEETAR